MRFIALHPTEQAMMLLKTHPNAFLLLTQIAMRARWEDCRITGVKAGDSFIGDWREAGLKSEMAYRYAKRTLESLGFVTFRGTSKGTVANLVDSSIFSITNDNRNGQSNRQGTGKEQARNELGTTNHSEHSDTLNTLSIAPTSGVREKKPKETKKLPTSPQAIQIAQLYNRRLTTAWSDKEIRAYKAITPIDQEDLDLVCQYTKREMEKGENGKHRRDLSTFLNNYHGEVDRARQEQSSKPAAPRQIKFID